MFQFEELRLTIEKIFTGELGAADGDERQLNIDHYLSAQDGALACERIVDVLEKMMIGRSELPKPAFYDRMEGWSVANGRRLVKGLLSYLPNSHNRPEIPASSISEYWPRRAEREDSTNTADPPKK